MVKIITDKPRSYRLMLQDQIPKFGNGLRFVSVVSIGHKWVVLTYHGKKAKIPQKMWVEILVNSNKRWKRQRKT